MRLSPRPPQRSWKAITEAQKVVLSFSFGKICTEISLKRLLLVGCVTPPRLKPSRWFLRLDWKWPKTRGVSGKRGRNTSPTLNENWSKCVCGPKGRASLEWQSRSSSLSYLNRTKGNNETLTSSIWRNIYDNKIIDIIMLGKSFPDRIWRAKFLFVGNFNGAWWNVDWVSVRFHYFGELMAHFHTDQERK